jgi:hypothetical protein
LRDLLNNIKIADELLVLLHPVLFRFWHFAKPLVPAVYNQYGFLLLLGLGNGD